MEGTPVVHLSHKAKRVADIDLICVACGSCSCHWMQRLTIPCPGTLYPPDGKGLSQ